MSELSEFLLARIAEDEFAIPWGDCRCGNIQRPDCPDRIAAECAAKRRVVNWCTDTGVGHWPVHEAPMRYLALPYADHEDYREEWKP